MGDHDSEVMEWRQQAILGRGRWNADDLRDIVLDDALEALADDDAVLVIDETGFLKQGKASCGVGRQYTGSAGKITGAAAGGGLLLSLNLPFASRVAEAADADSFAPNAFIRIEGDGQIVLTMPYVEMGQAPIPPSRC